MKRIADGVNYSKLPEVPAERYEQFLEYFGQDLMGFRNDALKHVYGQLERDSWDNLLPYDRDFFRGAAASFSPEQREMSRKLTERAITVMMERFMTMLTSHPQNQPLGDEHGIRYRLLAEVHHCPREKPTSKYRRPPRDENMEIEDFEPPDAAEPADTSDRPVLEEHDLSEGGQLYFANYWHRWMRRYGSY